MQLLLGGLLIWAAATGFSFLNGLFGTGASLAAQARPLAGVLPAVPRASVDRFDERRAWADLRAQVAYGPRTAGSETLARLAERLRGELPNGHLEALSGYPGLRNVVGELPGRAPAIVVGAHYDSKDVPGTAPGGGNGFLGANDSAGGTAVVLELARALARAQRRGGAPGRAVRFVLFDGEETPAGVPDSRFLQEGDRGSRSYVAAHRGEIAEMVLVDFVGNRGLRLPRELGSDAVLWARLRDAAARVGVGAVFPSGVIGAVTDDHTPFAMAGIPAIDLIDFDYACFHRACDTPDKLSTASLDAAGEALTELVLRERRR